MMPRHTSWASPAVLLLGSLLAPSSAAADKQPPAEDIRFFETRIRPLLAENCFKCHGEKKPKNGLRLDSRAGMLTGGEQGPAIVPGHPEKSLLIKAINYQELEMPPKKRLSAAQIADLTHWVQRGAPWPGADPNQPAPKPRTKEYQVTAEDRAHWSFQPVKRPPVPVVEDRAWVANPIDAFILAKLEAKGLTPNPPASRRELIRRVYYDLTGLPPTPQEVEAFVADPSPRAYEALVARLLGSPGYGEKWGRHWLDLVRFAETNSYERDNPKPHAWRYRDYVIRSFNDDKPYDQFIREQLAGDELPAAGGDALIATGYYRLGIWDDEPADREQARYDGLDDILATTGQVFLGLTVDCARCHDHKIDPIPQRDYYRLLAFFQNITPYRNGGPTDETPLMTDAQVRQDYEQRVRELDNLRRQNKAAIKAVEDDFRFLYDQGPFAQEDLPRLIQSDGARVLGRERFEHYQELLREQRMLKTRKVPAAMALCVTEMGRNAPETFILLRGNPHVPGDKVEPGFPQVLGGATPVIPTPAPEAPSSGRRLVLANWIASPDNPLTARVMANRLWQYHFSRGIVRSPNNFGLLPGNEPTHPELLDWLAAEFVRQGWHLKPLHRLILTSNAYRMSSHGNARGLAVDPGNDWFWRLDMRRLSAEEVRDSILAVSGTLNRKMYGPGVYPDIPAAVLAGQSRPGYGWGKSPPEEQARRSVYIHLKRSLLTPILESFDTAETDRSTPVRFVTTQPTQALHLLNGEFLSQQAALLAARLRREAGGDVTEQVRLALSLATTRPPRTEEVRRGVDLISALQQKDGATSDAALEYFCLMVLNLNEFLYLD
jgi:mono/diheme cytochrome c family protein